jgi:uncharacterized protein YciI
VRTKGKAWDASKPMRSQSQWPEHALFMDKLAAEGFVVLGGPLENSDDVLLAIKAADESEVTRTLEQDPWSKSGILETKSIHTWTVLLESPAPTSSAF